MGQGSVVRSVSENAKMKNHRFRSPRWRFVEISASPVGRNGYKASSLHAGPGGAGRSLSRRRRPRDGGRWVSRPAARRLPRVLVVAFSGAGGGWHGTPTSPPTGQPGRRRRVRAAGWAGFERAASRSCRPGAARDAAARDAAAPRLSRKMSRSEACSEFGNFTTLLVICPDDSTRIELNPKTTAPLPQDGFGMNSGKPQI